MPAYDSTRINKYIRESGICSRREADRFIEKGVVLLNGKRAGIGDRVSPGDRVTVNGREIEPKKVEETIYLAFNKPVGVVSTTDSSTRGNIISYIKHPQRIFPVGRLDKDSQGLILLTSNGDIVNKILRAGNKHEKEYVVTVDKPITENFIKGMQEGVPMLGKTTKRCQISRVTPIIFKITLIQGLNRQIRRMCEHFGYEVVKLERTRIMNISLKGLQLGEWRELTPQEITGLMKMVEKSTSAPKKAKEQNKHSVKSDKTDAYFDKKRKAEKSKKGKPPKKDGRKPKSEKSGRKKRRSGIR